MERKLLEVDCLSRHRLAAFSCKRVFLGVVTRYTCHFASDNLTEVTSISPRQPQSSNRSAGRRRRRYSDPKIWQLLKLEYANILWPAEWRADPLLSPHENVPPASAELGCEDLQRIDISCTVKLDVLL